MVSFVVVAESIRTSKASESRVLFPDPKKLFCEDVAGVTSAPTGINESSAKVCGDKRDAGITLPGNWVLAADANGIG